jgi:hypothetical protein
MASGVKIRAVTPACDPHRPSQQAKLVELRAARDFARLWGEQGRRTEARDLLAGFRLVHRGLRHRRFERGEGAARRAEVSW